MAVVLDGAPLMKFMKQKGDAETPEREALVGRISAISSRGKAESSHYASCGEPYASPPAKRVFK